MSSDTPKLPHQASLEELLDALEKAKDTSTPKVSKESSVIDFIAFYQISPGDHPIKPELLYDLYGKWSKRRVTKSVFTQEIHKYFQNDKSFVYINRDQLAIGEEIQEFLRQKPSSLSYSTDINNIEAFLKRFDIKSGTYVVENFILFYLYKKWSRIQRTEEWLARWMRNYFQEKILTRNKIPAFCIHPSILKHITEEEMNQIRQGRKNFPNGKRKKQKK